MKKQQLGMTLSMAVQLLFVAVATVTSTFAALVDVKETARAPCNHISCFHHQLLPPPTGVSTADAIPKTQRQNLLLGDMRGHDRTIALVDGSASDTVSYLLRLPRDEFITSLSHVPNDTSIITESNTAQTTHTADGWRVENITLTHQFEGIVGTAKFTITAITNKGRTSMATGRYYITGITGISKSANGTKFFVTGVAAPEITYESPNDVTLQSKEGIMAVKIRYQAPGPDVSKTPPSIADIMKKTEVHVTGRSLSSKSKLLNTDKCKTVTAAHKTANGKYVFADKSCFVAFDSSTGNLLVRLNPAEAGYATVTLTTPALDPSGESAEATIRISVKEPPKIHPVLFMNTKQTIKLDYFGKEIFTLVMSKTLKPDQPNNATDYVIDLPGNRYARADFKLSRITNNLQFITFETRPSGTEDAAVMKNLKNVLENARKQATLAAMESPEATPTASPEETHDGVILGHPSERYNSDPRHRSVWDVRLNLGFGLRFPSKLLSSPESTPMVSPEEPSSSEVSGPYTSNVHVMIPPIKSFQSAENPRKKKLVTEFAPDTLAELSKQKKDPAKTYLSISLVLYNYSMDSFSEHKSQQLGKTLAGIVSEKSEAKTDSELVHKKQRNSDMIVTYRIFTATKSAQIARNMTKVDQGVATKIEKKAMLRTGSVAVYDAIVIPGFGDPNYNGAGGSGNSLTGSTLGLVIAAIVALSLIILIPCFVFCFGFFVTRRRGEGSGGEGEQIEADYGAVGE